MPAQVENMNREDSFIKEFFLLNGLLILFSALKNAVLAVIVLLDCFSEFLRLNITPSHLDFIARIKCLVTNPERLAIAPASNWAAVSSVIESTSNMLIPLIALRIAYFYIKKFDHLAEFPMVLERVVRRKVARTFNRPPVFVEYR